ncbi:MAG: pyridoxamine 5'-phosphate oxidase family protein [Haloplanus sp.]
MTAPESVEMDAPDRDDFLGTGGTGVLSFSRPADDPPHSIPVSFGYDARETTFYFRLSVGPDSEKAVLLDRPVTVVVYGRDDDRWKSVVATGRLEESTETDIATETLQGLDRVHIPMVDIFGRPPKEVPFAVYRLVPEEMTARVETPTTVE